MCRENQRESGAQCEKAGGLREGHRPASSGPVTHHVISCIQVLSVVVTEEEILEGLLGCVAEEDVSCVLAECGFERPQQASVAVEGCAYLGLRA